MSSLNPKFLSLMAFTLLLTSCGGGGSSIKNSLEISYDYTTGNPSSLELANSNILLGSERNLPYDGPSGNTFSSLSQAHSTLNNGLSYPIATRDTLANNVWSSGWTGKGIKVGILDSFNSNGRIDSHGDWVSLVLNSISPEANTILSNLPSGNLSTTLQNANSAFDYYNTNEYYIVNNSWGFEKPLKNSFGSYTGTNNPNWDDIISDAVTSKIMSINQKSEPIYNEKMLFVFAAGNGAQYCGSAYVTECDYFATVYNRVRNQGYVIGEDTIFVGALSDQSSTIANYSYQAGNMLNDFIVAHDDVLFSGDASGTSFSAPRVSGAAALVRQKFPNLTGIQIKQVLLQTATDLGASGPDNIYGYGKLNLENAMSPQGRVIAK